MISLIVACARNNAIGRDNTIPWHAPEDLKFFQRETLGGAVIMGRNTWDSLPFKPLKNRFNIVVSSQGVEAENVVSSLDAAIELAQAAGYHRIYGIGGSGIYAGLLPRADRLLITDVDLDVPDADTFFPELTAQDWTVSGAIELRTEAPKCRVVEYLRKRG
ncbi:MAG: dihydrofolate reductase [Rhodobacteraceae bacterium]|nr:dihydrofolate reductase [Paracoccaceae bacterium]